MVFGICCTSQGCKNKNICHSLASPPEICFCKMFDGQLSLAVWTSLHIWGRRRIVLNSFVPQSHFWMDKALEMFIGLCQLSGLVFVLDTSFSASSLPQTNVNVRNTWQDCWLAVLAGMLTQRQPQLGEPRFLLSPCLRKSGFVLLKCIWCLTEESLPTEVVGNVFLTELSWPFAGGSRNFNQKFLTKCIVEKGALFKRDGENSSQSYDHQSHQALVKQV